MEIKPFLVEEWMNQYEVGARYNIAETCVDSVSLDELFQLTGEDKEAFLSSLCARRLTYGDIFGQPAFLEGICRLYRDLRPEQVIPTHGAAGANHHLFCSLVEPGDKVISVLPTYQQLYSIPDSLGAQVELLPLSPDNGFLPDLARLEELAQEGVKLICLNNPNNPTGRLMDGGLLGRVLSRCREVGAFLAVDQCFLELTAARPARLTDQLAGGNLILFRALTKSYALAGLRLGYCLCGDRALLEQMARILQPWPVSIPAQIAGECALQAFPRWPFTCFPEIERERDRLQAALEELGLWVCPSESCFLLFCGPEDLGKRLRENGILVRDCANYAGLGPGWYRAGLRTPEENGRLIAALSTLLRGE